MPARCVKVLLWGLIASLSLMLAACGGTSGPLDGTPEPQRTALAPAASAPSPTPEAPTITSPTHTPEPTPTSTPKPIPAPLEAEAFLPPGGKLRRTLAADLDNDGWEESALSFTHTPKGAPPQLSLVTIDWDGKSLRVAWQSQPCIGERDERLEARDINGDGTLEILSGQSMGAAGTTLYVFAWDGESYRQFEPLGGHFQGMGRFGEVGYRLEDLDGDGLEEILAVYGPAGHYVDIYQWDGANYRLAKATAATHSPTLKKPQFTGIIAFIRQGDLWVVKPDGSELKRLTTSGAISHPILSPNGKRIAFHSAPEAIWVIDIEGTHPVKLTEKAQTLPAWSPDGKSLAYIEDGNLVLAGRDGKGRTILEVSAAKIISPEAAALHWSATSRTILYGKETASNRAQLTMLDTTDESEQILAEGPVTSFILSPDGRKVCYTRLGDAPLWLVETTGGQPRRLIADAHPIKSLAWSPDGQKIAYALSGTLYLFTVTSGELQEVGPLADPTGVGPYELAWSPDGKYLVQVNIHSPGQGLWLIALRSGEQWRLTQGEDSNPSWG